MPAGKLLRWRAVRRAGDERLRKEPRRPLGARVNSRHIDERLSENSARRRPGLGSVLVAENIPTVDAGPAPG
ncbi:MAG TPA: hypothetical protein VEF72_10315 [Mycobacterium sp.]|nr:hypothetical protein [Mycobacterium sp.]